MNPQDFTKYGMKLLKVPTGTGSVYQLYEGGKNAGLRDVSSDIATNLLGKGIQAIDILSLSPEEQTKFNTGSLYAGQNVGKKNLTSLGEYESLYGGYQQNEAKAVVDATEQARVKAFNADPLNTTSQVGKAPDDPSNEFNLATGARNPNYKAPNATAPVPTLLKQGVGSSTAPNPEIKAIQAQLGITADGIFGPQTKSAIMKFQQENGLQVDGIIGPITKAALQKVASGATTQPKENIMTVTIPNSTTTTTRAPDDPSNQLNTVTGLPNPKWINPTTGKTLQQEKDEINTNANAEAEKLLAQFKTTLGTKVDVSDSSKLIKAITDSLAAPAKPTTSLVDTLAAKRTELGVGAKETELSSIDSEIAKLDADNKALQESNTNRVQSLSQINRRKSADQLNYEKTRNELALKRTAVVNELNQKYSVIDTFMKYTGADYENAQQEYTTKFNQAIQATNLIKGIEEDAKSDAEKKVDNARANAQLMMTALKDKKIDFTKLDSATLLDIRNLEAQADLPSGFIQFAASAVDEPIISIGSEFTDANGNRQVPIYTKNPSTGVVTTQVTTLGTGSPTTGDTTKIYSDFLKTGTAPNGTKVGAPMGSDGYVDPDVYNTAFQQWNGSITEFLSKFPVEKYVNPTSYSKLPDSIQPKTKRELPS